MGARGASLLLLALAACAPPGGPAAPDYARLSRPLTEGYVQIVSAGPRLVELNAAGRTVRAPAPDGLCIPIDSVQTARGAAFLLIEDCPGAARTLRGVLSLSIGAGPMPEGFAALERFFRTDAGTVSLGYGGDSRDVALIAIEEEGGALFTVVEDRSEFGPAFAGDLIVRAFFEVNGRMAVATMISRRGEDPDPEAMRARLARLKAAMAEASA